MAATASAAAAASAPAAAAAAATATGKARLAGPVQEGTSAASEVWAHMEQTGPCSCASH